MSSMESKVSYQAFDALNKERMIMLDVDEIVRGQKFTRQKLTLLMKRDKSTQHLKSVSIMYMYIYVYIWMV